MKVIPIIAQVTEPVPPAELTQVIADSENAFYGIAGLLVAMLAFSILFKIVKFDGRID